MNPSEVLGVPPGAPPAEVRRAFATAVRSVHPDVGGAPADAGRRMAELVEARDLLLAGRGGARPSGSPPVTIYHRARGLERWLTVLASALLGRDGRSDGHRDVR